jgi:hypothetical protein
MVALQNQFSPLAVIGGQQFFRLNQTLESGGDIFEIDSGVKALAIGSESDVADLLVTFFDKQQPNTNIDQVIISPASPFIGRLDALLATQIPSSMTPARLQVTVRDLVNNTYFPRTFDNEGLQRDLFMARVSPRIDLLAYLSDPAFLPAGRADRQHFFPYVQTSPSTGVGWVILPFYGRRYAHANFMNLHATVTYTVTLFGVCLSAGTTAGGATKQSETTLGNVVLAPNAVGNIVHAAVPQLAGNPGGLYDLLEVRVSADTPIAAQFDFNSTLRVTVSDQE